MSMPMYDDRPNKFEQMKQEKKFRFLWVRMV